MQTACLCGVACFLPTRCCIMTCAVMVIVIVLSRLLCRLRQVAVCHPRLVLGDVSVRTSRGFVWPSDNSETSWRSPRPLLVRVEALTARCVSRGCPVDARLRPHAEGAGRISSTSLLQLTGVERLPRAKNEIWYLGSQTPNGGRRATKVDEQAA